MTNYRAGRGSLYLCGLQLHLNAKRPPHCHTAAANMHQVLPEPIQSHAHTHSLSCETCFRFNHSMVPSLIPSLFASESPMFVVTGTSATPPRAATKHQHKLHFTHMVEPRLPFFLFPPSLHVFSSFRLPSPLVLSSRALLPDISSFVSD